MGADTTALEQAAGHIANIRKSYARPVTIDEVMSETGLTATEAKASIAGAAYLQLFNDKIDYA